MKRLSLAESPYYHYLEEDDNFRRWVESLERVDHHSGRLLYEDWLSSKLKVEPGRIAAMNTREARHHHLPRDIGQRRLLD